MTATEAAGVPAAEVADPLVCTVSTVKDSVENIVAFVRRNQAAGADHMFVFLDGGDDVARARLRRMPGVTALNAGPAYWRGQRPPSLNQRQVVNANLVNVLLTLVPSVGWLFHLDGDECLDLDRATLRGLGPDVPAVRLAPLEAASREHWDGPVDLFKRPLEYAELCVLVTLGLIEHATMSSYYNGHRSGKSGLRPSLDRRLGVHAVRNLDGSELEHHADDRLRLLHYEAPSAAEFVRKWSTLAGAGTAKFSKKKERMRQAITSILTNDRLDEERRREYILRIYRRQVADDVDTLQELGFLVTPDPTWHAHTPRPLAGEDLEVVAELLPLLRRADKKYLMIGDEAVAPHGLVRELAEQVPDGPAGQRLRAAVARLPEGEAPGAEAREERAADEPLPGPVHDEAHRL